MKEKVVDDTSKGSIRSRKKINLVSDQDLKTIKQEEGDAYSTKRHICLKMILLIAILFS